MEKLGIEDVKTAAVKSINFATGVYDRVKDGKFDLGEIIATAADIPSLIFIFNNFSIIIDQISDMNSDEVTELCDYVRENVNIAGTNEQLTEVIVSGIFLIGGIYADTMQFIEAIKALNNEKNTKLD
ncbi:MAG: hypothetical protein PHQ69_11050 [Bacteroidales bacterium]|jgi:hypothetical protein|nr:hypothetical protein [Bacteroidales bacterium]